MEYDFFAPPRISFGWGRRREIGTLARTLGKRAFLFSGSRTLEKNGAIAELTELLQTARVPVVRAPTITHEPLTSDVDTAVEFLLAHQSRAGDVLIAVGGGAVIDLAKAAGAVATSPRSRNVTDFLEGVGRGFPVDHQPLPLMALPTTGGTGSEATKNAVISSIEPPYKKSLRSEQMLPRIVLVDPELAVSVPPNVTAWTGLDAITQLIESYISRRAQPLPQALARQGLDGAFPALEAAFRDGASRPGREKMAHAALLSGMALANSGLGMAHGVAAALGIHCQVPHGLACAMLLPVALLANRQCRAEQLAELGRITSGRETLDRDVAVQALIERVDGLLETLSIPRRLSGVGVRPEQIPVLVTGSRGNSMSGNPRDISDSELRDLLEALL